MIHVGLTGNVASGKSTVAARLAAIGATVLDADRYARDALAPTTPALARVIARFGASVLTSDGALDRGALARVVFHDVGARRDLEAIVHPEVAHRRAADVAAARARGESIIVSDVPLLFEAGLEQEFDSIVLVDAPAEQRFDRLTRSRGMTPTDARALMAAQGDAGSKRPRANHLVVNDGTLSELEAKVDALWRLLTS